MFAIPVRFPPPCVKMRPMRLDLSPLEKSLTRLETSVSYWRSDAARADAGLRREFSQSVIQGFEYTYGATVAMIDRALREHSREQDSILEMDFADRMRAAADLGIVRDWRDFLEYRRKRNTTSHAYNENLAEDVLASVDDFISDSRFVLERLRERGK